MGTAIFSHSTCGSVPDTYYSVLKKETLLSNKESTVSFIKVVTCGLNLQKCQCHNLSRIT